MPTPPEQKRKPKFLENSLLLLTGLVAHTPLYYQIPRWANGLDPTFVHPNWIARSSFPIVLHLATIHPLVWISIMILAFIQICRNYGWSLRK